MKSKWRTRLQVTLKENNGRSANFRDIVFVMTTNAGAREMNRASIGFTRQDHSTDGMAMILA